MCQLICEKDYICKIVAIFKSSLENLYIRAMQWPKPWSIEFDFDVESEKTENPGCYDQSDLSWSYNKTPIYPYRAPLPSL